MQEIRQLVARYALAVDARDLDALVELFVDDVNVGVYGSGRVALRRSFEESLSSVGITVLHVTTQVIDLVDAVHARRSAYCRGEVQDGARWLQQSILYSDVYRREDRWLFVRRRHELFYGAPVGVNPLGLPRPTGRSITTAWVPSPPAGRAGGASGRPQRPLRPPGSARSASPTRRIEQRQE